MRFLNKEESWCLFCQKVFAKKLCPPELEKAGKKIVANCEGLPLTIVTVSGLLSKVEKTLEYWNEVAEKQNSIFTQAHDQMSKVLSPYYEYLPQHLKACFLYMGVFPQNYEIPSLNFAKLWPAEGFLQPNSHKTVEDFALECLVELYYRNLVRFRYSNFSYKTFYLHSIFWHLSNKEATKNKFFQALNSYDNNSMECMKSQRRLCIRNNILLGIKDVHTSMASMASVSTARSLLCTGPPHQYPVTICFSFRLLRVLDALAIRFYEFPVEVVKLIHLRYLALTCNRKLPASISKLWNLQYLVVNRSLGIKSFEDSSYLPIEIWDMKELRHLQIMGRSLPNPNYGALLPNLVFLLNVSAHNFTKSVLKRISNLKRLGIQIELAPGDNGKSFCCLNRISRLHKLERLKCVLVNPELMFEVAALPAPLSMFPSHLKKLSLSGLGYPWEYMSVIGKLQNLEILKLKCYAFRGLEWETDCYTFQALKFLLIEDTDLVRWNVKMSSFSKLECLNIKHCYQLEELPPYLSSHVEMITIVDCNPFTVTWAKQMKMDNLALNVYGHSSWDAENLK